VEELGSSLPPLEAIGEIMLSARMTIAEIEAEIARAGSAGPGRAGGGSGLSHLA
jgi:hypothetical protein